MTIQSVIGGKVRTGHLSAYVTSSRVERVRQVRDRVGAITVSGEGGLKVLRALARTGDLRGVDLDPALYAGKPNQPEGLFGIDWEAEQLDLGLAVVRSAGVAVRRGDRDGLRLAMSTPVRHGSRRLMSLHSSWLLGEQRREVAAALRNCDEPVSLVFADLFDPFAADGAIDGLQGLLEAASAPDRPVELLRADTQAIPFALAGGAQGAIGLTTSGRHHPLPFPKSIRERYEERQRSAWVWVEQLLGWEKGAYLSALAPFGETRLLDCPCDPCDGEPLTQYAREWPQEVPAAIRERAQDHDAARWLATFGRLQRSDAPLAAWRRLCSQALQTQAFLESEYRISALKVPSSVAQWASAS